MKGKHKDKVQKREAQVLKNTDELVNDGPVMTEDPVNEESKKQVSDDKNDESLASELEVLRLAVEEYKEMAMRAQAELENVRKRTVRDIENAHKYALEKFINELLPVLDSMELGINASDNSTDGEGDITSLREGMDLTLKMFQTTLGKFGIKVINPQDEKFNPEQHEAVTMQELEGKEPGTVISVMQKGYELNGRLVRPAMVIVAK